MAEGASEETSIYEAAREGNVEAVRRCLSADAESRNGRDRLSRTPYPRLLLLPPPPSSQLQQQQWIRAACPPPSSQLQQQQWIRAAYLLLLHSCSSNSGYVLPASPSSVLFFNLTWAGQAEVVRLLCDVGADVGAAAMDDMAAIHFACQKGHTEVVRILLAAGAYVNVRNRKGMTAIHFAVQGKRDELTKLLIKKGANLSTENKAGKKPIDLAVDESFKTLIREAEQERNARRTKNKEKEKEKLSSGMEEIPGLERQGEEAEEVRPITVPERPSEPQSKEVEDAESVRSITVPERPGTVRETQLEEVVNGKSPKNLEKKSGIEVSTDSEGHQSIEPKRKKAKVSLLSFGDDNEDEIE